jgi:hypothetical protein
LLVIICLVKSFYVELNIRFFGPTGRHFLASKRSNREAHHQRESRPLASHSNISAKVREAGTLPRSPRFIWRAGTPEAPLQWPSGTETLLLFAALARDHAKLARRLALNARIGERW